MAQSNLMNSYVSGIFTSKIHKATQYVSLLLTYMNKLHIWTPGTTSASLSPLHKCPWKQIPNVSLKSGNPYEYI